MEVKTSKATVRIHGVANQDNLKKATTDFLKKVTYQKKKGEVR